MLSLSNILSSGLINEAMQTAMYLQNKITIGIKNNAEIALLLSTRYTTALEQSNVWTVLLDV